MSLATSLPIVVPQWGFPTNVMIHCDVMEHKTNAISEHRGDLYWRSRYGDHVQNRP